MSIDNAIPQLWLGRLLDAYYRETVWGNLFTDLSNETPVGSKLNMITISNEPTIRDYTRESELSDPEYPDDSLDILPLDQQKYFNIAVDDVDEMQTRPSLLDGWARTAGRAMARKVDDHLRSTFENAASVKASVTSSNFDALGAVGSDKTLPDVVDTFLTSFIKDATGKDWPKGAERWCVGCDNLTLLFQEWMIGNASPGTGRRGDDAPTDADISAMFGIHYVTDSEMDEPTADGDTIAYIGTKQAASYALQIKKIEPYRPSNRFGDAIKGLYVYGADVMWVTNAIKMDLSI